MYTRYLKLSTLYTIALSISDPNVFSYIVMQYTSTPVFLNTGGLRFYTCIYSQRGVLSGKARKQVLQTTEGLAASISTEQFRSCEVGFSNQITLKKVQASLI